MCQKDRHERSWIGGYERSWSGGFSLTVHVIWHGPFLEIIILFSNWSKDSFYPTRQIQGHSRCTEIFLVLVLKNFHPTDVHRPVSPCPRVLCETDCVALWLLKSGTVMSKGCCGSGNSYTNDSGTCVRHGRRHDWHTTTEPASFFNFSFRCFASRDSWYLWFMVLTPSACSFIVL